MKTAFFACPLFCVALESDGAFLRQVRFAQVQDGAVNSEPDPVLNAAFRWLEAYCQGEPAPLPPMDFSCLPPFRRQVTEILTTVPFGQVTTYGRLAAAAGSPRAARAVGHVMATNLWPLFVPCHRVLAAGGLGGFSGGEGLALKEKLLNFERALTQKKALP